MPMMNLEFTKMADELDAQDVLIRKLIKERDLAIAHDTQPYPTAFAYEQVCKVLEEAKAENARLHEKCRDFAAQAETDAGIIKADGNEIHFLRAERDRLRDALEYVATCDDSWNPYELRNSAQEALKGQQ